MYTNNAQQDIRSVLNVQTGVRQIVNLCYIKSIQ